MQPEANVEQKVVEDQDKNVVAQDQEPPQERNWKNFRAEREAERKQLEQERKQRQEREKEAAALKAALEAALSKPEPKQPQETPYEELSEQERIRKEVDDAVEARLRKIEEARQLEEQAKLPLNLKKAYSDFDQVCSTENLDYLEFHYPEVANAYKYMPDGFDKWSSIYKAVKRFIPNVDGKKEAARVDRNLQKPQSASALTQAGHPMPPANDLTEERRKANWERMQRTMRGQG